MQEDLTAAHVDPRAYLRPIWARKWYILAAVIVTTAATYFYYDHKPREYRATASVFVKSSALDQALAGGFTFTDDQRNTANQAALIRTRSVAKEVAQDIGYKGDPGALLGSVSATAASETDFVTITATQGSASEAPRLANSFAAAFIKVRSASFREKAAAAQRVAEAQLAQLGNGSTNAAARTALRTRIRQLRVIQSLPAGVAEVSDPAVAPGGPSYPHPRKNATFAFFLALVFAVAAVFLVELFDRRVKSIEDIEATYPYPVLAVIPRETDVAPRVDGAITFARTLREAFRSLRTSVDLSVVDRDIHVVLVTSAVAGEGKSTVVRNLALAYHEAGRSVVVIETDLRKPTLARLFAVEKRPGLTDALAGAAPLADALQQVPVQKASATPLVQAPPVDASARNGDVDATQLALLTSGPQPPNPPAILASQRVHDFIDNLHHDFDVVIIDSPPLLAVSDAVPLLPKADAVLVVTRLGHTTRAAGRRLVDVLNLVPDVRPAGIVVNDLASNRLTETGFEYYYYGPSES